MKQDASIKSLKSKSVNKQRTLFTDCPWELRLFRTFLPNNILLYFTGFGHYGVVVTTPSGTRWLIHKGFGFSRLSHSVVTSAKHMSKRWKLIEKQKVRNVKVGDYLRIAGRYFHPDHDNAFHAAKRMMELGKNDS